MSEKKILARPYARAAFEVALTSKQVSQWSTVLAMSAQVVTDDVIARLIINPQVTDQAVADIILEAIGELKTSAVENFFTVLIENSRLAVLPQIYQLYELHRLAYEQSMEVEVVTIAPLNKSHQATLEKVLAQKFNCRIELNNSIDKSLIGGAIIRMGDRIIDGSIRGKLNRLKNYILLKDRVWQ